MSEPPVLDGPVHVVGAGLLGTSIGLALQRTGVEVWLSDLNHEHVRTASGLGAGTPAPPDPSGAQVVVAACPPAHIADVVVEALENLGRGSVVTDVGSVKALPLGEVADRVGESGLGRYVGSHPMAGSERSGPLAAAATLFEGRPWAVTPHVHADPDAVALVEQLVRRCGAEPVRLSPVEHDNAVARTSHIPHLLAVLAAGRLAEAMPEHLAMSGQGVRDVTRIAAGDPALYSQIIRANAHAVVELLAAVRGELDIVMAALSGEEADADEALEEVLTRGVAGTRLIPGKHGGPPLETAAVYVAVPDTPGELARLLADVGDIGVNLEDLRIDHDPGRAVGLVEVVVAAGAAEALRESLEARKWVTHR
ncbi:MAG: prephenate dehydrogenase [Marmoricola sp.]